MDQLDKSLYEAYVSSGQALGYNEIKDELNARYPYYKRLLKLMGTNRKGISILDMGCGFGGLLLFLKENGYNNLVGVDISEEQVQLGKSLGLDFLVQGESLSFLKSIPDNKYDVIFFIDVLEHFDKNSVFRILKETKRVIKNNGKILIHVPNGQGVFGIDVFASDLTHKLLFTGSSISQLINIIKELKATVYEDKPLIYNVTSFLRRIIWEIGMFPFRLIYLSETGRLDVKLSRNITVVLNKVKI